MHSSSSTSQMLHSKTTSNTTYSYNKLPIIPPSKSTLHSLTDISISSHNSKSTRKDIHSTGSGAGSKSLVKSLRRPHSQIQDNNNIQQQQQQQLQQQQLNNTNTNNNNISITAKQRKEKNREAVTKLIATRAQKEEMLEFIEYCAKQTRDGGWRRFLKLIDTEYM